MRGLIGTHVLPFRIFHLLIVIRYTQFVNCLDIKVSKDGPNADFHEVSSGILHVDEGSSLFLQCVSEYHYSSNSSLVWTVSTKAWESSMWMNHSEMGLIEVSDYTEDVFTSTLYINSTGVKDVGSYICTQISNDVMDIDEVTTQPLYVFVRGSSLTTSDTGQVILIDSSHPLILPCTPTHTAVTISVTANGQDVTQLFKFDPMVGFTAISTMSVSSFTCYFTYENNTESVHLKQLSSSLDPTSSPSHLPVTLHLKQDTVDTLDTIEIVCKVVTEDDEAADIYWTVPGLKTHELHKDDLTVLYTDKFSMEEIIIEGVIVSTLMVEEVGEEDQGIYRCRAEQFNGQSGEADIFINVEDKLTDLVTVLPFHAHNDFIHSSSSGNNWCLLHNMIIVSLLILLQV